MPERTDATPVLMGRKLVLYIRGVAGDVTSPWGDRNVVSPPAPRAESLGVPSGALPFETER